LTQAYFSIQGLSLFKNQNIFLVGDELLSIKGEIKFKVVDLFGQEINNLKLDDKAEAVRT